MNMSVLELAERLALVHALTKPSQQRRYSGLSEAHKGKKEKAEAPVLSL